MRKFFIVSIYIFMTLSAFSQDSAFFKGVFMDHGVIAKSVTKQHIMGLPYITAGNHKAAIKYYSKCIKKNDEDFISYAIRAYEYDFIGKSKKSLNDYNRAVQINPNNAIVWVYSGGLKDYLGDINGAIDNYTHAIKADSTFYDSYQYRGYKYLKTNKLEPALADFKKFIQYNPQDTDAYIMAADLLVEMNRYEESIPYYNEFINKKPMEPLGFYTRSNARIFLGDYENGFADVFQALKLDYPELVQYDSLFTSSIKPFSLESLTSCYSTILQKHPQIVAQYNNLGYEYISLKKYDQAKDIFNKTLSIKDNFIDAFMGLSLVYYYEGDLKKSNVYLKKIIKHNREITKGEAGFFKFQNQENVLYDSETKATIFKMLEYNAR